MAKRKVNKSEVIREFLKANSAVGPTEASKVLSEQIGSKITPAFVSNIKQKLLKGASGTGKRGRPKSGSGKGGTVQTSSPRAASAIDVLKAAQQFVAAAGGVDSAKEILEVLEAHFINNG